MLIDAIDLNFFCFVPSKISACAKRKEEEEEEVICLLKLAHEKIVPKDASCFL